MVQRLERLFGQLQRSLLWYWLSLPPHRPRPLEYTLQVIRLLQIRHVPTGRQITLRATPAIQESLLPVAPARATAPMERPTRLLATTTTTTNVLTMRMDVPTSLKILRKFVEPTEL
jgi:hypothetical protein